MSARDKPINHHQNNPKQINLICITQALLTTYYSL